MPITVSCPNCDSKLKGSAKVKGRTVTCPKCSQPFAVTDSTITDDDSTIPLAPIQGQSVPSPKLITCPACGQKIAPAAKSCPSCGNPNTYVHPEIQRFLDSAQTFRQAFDYKVEGFVLSGWAVVERGANKTLSHGIKLCLASCFLCLIPFLLPIAGLLLLVGICMVLSTFFSTTKVSDYVSRFTIDFNQTPPAWHSDEDVFWKEVKSFFLGKIN
jgi:DNA-directed RNA polymerase subunit M/transcription elongation factor TFIIS